MEGEAGRGGEGLGKYDLRFRVSGRAAAARA